MVKSKIDINRVDKQFKNYIANYDIENPKIALKVNHIYRVAQNSRKIAEGLNLDDEQVKLAEVIGYLHDIGRFEQVKNYNTFLDNKSVNHAEEGLKVLFQDEKKLLRKFIEDDEYDNIIYKAILNHNRLNYDTNLKGIEDIQAKVIRDADKVDIFKVVTTDTLENTTSSDDIKIEDYVISDEIYNDFNNEQLINYKKINNCLDYMVAWTAYIYDINYIESLKMIKEKDYIDDIFDMASNANTKAKIQIANIKEKANQYIDFKISNL